MVLDLYGLGYSVSHRSGLRSFYKCAAVLLEGARIVRCDDSPVNSVFAGTAASYMLISLQSKTSHLSLPVLSASQDLKDACNCGKLSHA